MTDTNAQTQSEPNEQPKDSLWDRKDLEWMQTFHGFYGFVGFLWSLPMTILRLFLILLSTMLPSLRFHRRVGWLFIFTPKPDTTLARITNQYGGFAGGCIIIVSEFSLNDPQIVGSGLRVSWHQFTLGPLWLLVKPVLHALNYLLDSSPEIIFDRDAGEWAQEFYHYANDNTDYPMCACGSLETDNTPVAVRDMYKALVQLGDDLLDELQAEESGGKRTNLALLYGWIWETQRVVSDVLWGLQNHQDPVFVPLDLQEPITAAGNTWMRVCCEVDRIQGICALLLSAAASSKSMNQKDAYMASIARVTSFLSTLEDQLERL